MIRINQKKLQTLAEIEGRDSVEVLLVIASIDSIAPGICMNPHCDYSTEVEPDQQGGYCESCGTPTVKSCLVLAGVI